MNAIIDGRSLDEKRGEMEKLVTIDRRRFHRLANYDSWAAYIAEMKREDKYTDILFVYGFSASYNVLVRIISDIYDESLDLQTR